MQESRQASRIGRVGLLVLLPLGGGQPPLTRGAVNRAALNSGDRQSSAMRLFASASSFALTGMALLFWVGTLSDFGAGFFSFGTGSTAALF